MTYSGQELSVQSGRPFYLYLFATSGGGMNRFTSTDQDYDDGSNVWTAIPIQHSRIDYTSDPRKASVDLTFEASNAFAQSYVGQPQFEPTTLTIYRGHLDDPDGEVVAHWKGQVIQASLEDTFILMTANNILDKMKRQGGRPVYARTCRHVLYRAGCGLNIDDFYVDATATAYSGLTVSVSEVPDGAETLFPLSRFRGGILEFNGNLRFILGLTLNDPSVVSITQSIPALEAEIDANGSASVRVAPGCLLNLQSCLERFDNVDNYGGFPGIPETNPFGNTVIF